MTPAISVLITTYNRKEMLKRCLSHVLEQTFTDFEVIVIDDASTDGTTQFLESHADTRVKHLRNQENMGALHGDRVHIQRFVKKFAKGKYFVYICDDDLFLMKTLLARQIALFEAYPSTAMVTGGQVSDFIVDGRERLHFHEGAFPSGYLNSEAFLEYFSAHPIEANINTGARLYNRELFIKSGALQNEGSKWQAGYELTLGPGCYGGHVYIDEPCLQTTIKEGNASFNGTQLEHYQDSVKSVVAAFEKPMKDFPDRNLFRFKRDTIEKISQAYLANAEYIRAAGFLNMCSAHNISRPVTWDDVEATEAAAGI